VVADDALRVLPPSLMARQFLPSTVRFTEKPARGNKKTP
jgi:hypothetical protein